MDEREKANILLVDDQPAKLLTYEAILRDLDANLIKATSAHEAFNYLLKNDVAVILIDVFMPELDGYQLASMVREHPRFQQTPIIFISAIALSELDRLRGYESGAVDYVPVPVVPEILRAKVRIFVELFKKTRDLERLNRELEDRVIERTAALEASNEQLKESEQRLRLASEAAEFGTYDYNPAAGYFECSPLMKQLFGLDNKSEVTPDTFLQCVYEPDRAMVRRSIFAPERNEDNRHRIEFRVSHAEGFRWLLDCGRAFFSDGQDDAPLRVMGTVLDITERKQAEERQLLLIAELDHRVKNILANIGAIAKLSSRSTGSVNDYVEALDARIQAVAKAHSVLRRDSWDGIDLRTYLGEVLAPFITRKGKTISFSGDPIQLSPKAAQSLALVFHELATNAVKYGALSATTGKVTVTWERTNPNNTIRITWRETGGPVPIEPERHGFGTTVINTVAAELEAQATHVFDPAGVVFSFEGAIENTSAARHVAPKALSISSLETSTDASIKQRVRILLVEDEVLVGLQTKSDLEAAGHKIAGLATTVRQGLDYAEGAEFDFALLDVRLGEEYSVPIAEKLRNRNIPFAFVTGFEDQNILPLHLQDVPRINKPYDLSSILTTINNYCTLHAGKEFVFGNVT